MAARVTQQIVTVVYKPSNEVRLSTFAVEVIRSNAGSPAVNANAVVFCVAGG